MGKKEEQDSKKSGFERTNKAQSRDNLFEDSFSLDSDDRDSQKESKEDAS